MTISKLNYSVNESTLPQALTSDGVISNINYSALNNFSTLNNYSTLNNKSTLNNFSTLNNYSTLNNISSLDNRSLSKMATTSVNIDYLNSRYSSLAGSNENFLLMTDSNMNSLDSINKDSNNKDSNNNGQFKLQLQNSSAENTQINTTNINDLINSYVAASSPTTDARFSSSPKSGTFSSPFHFSPIGPPPSLSHLPSAPSDSANDELKLDYPSLGTIDIYEIRARKRDIEARKFQEELQRMSEQLTDRLKAIPSTSKRSYKKESIYVRDLYTLTYEDGQTLEQIKHVSIYSCI